nr:Chain A, Molybdopterin biosynthesis protein [Mycobacteroides abscessus ATCC 19977]3TCR_B Chain B, Molybdopterin biosynthesis protein [Mycobacteroides abscessus ATCC 19977]
MAHHHHHHMGTLEAQTQGPGSMTSMSPRTVTVASMAELEAGPVGRSLVVIVNDRTAHGDQDTSGPLVTELLAEAGFVVDGVVVVENDLSEIQNAVNTAVIGGVDLVVTVGGTGVTPRDVAPEATQPLLDRELLGIAEAIRSSGLAAGVTEAGLSRGVAGISGSTLVVNIAGSRAAVRDGMATLTPMAIQIIEQLSSLEI